MDAPERELQVGDKVWWWIGDLLVHCTVTYVDRQWREKSPDGILFYEIDEPVGHSLSEDELPSSFKEAVGRPEDWEDVEGDGNEEREEPSLEAFRRRAVRFILSTRLDGPDYGNKEKITEEAVDKALVEWEYPAKQHGEDWFTADEAFEEMKKAQAPAVPGNGL